MYEWMEKLRKMYNINQFKDNVKCIKQSMNEQKI